MSKVHLKAWALPTQLCSFRFFDSTLECAAKVFNAGTSYPLCLGRCSQECTAQDVVHVFASLLVPTKGPRTTGQLVWLLTALRMPAGEPCIPKQREKETLGLLRCSLFCELLGGTRRRYSPSTSFFPNELAFPPSFLPVSQTVLSCFLLWFCSSLKLA